MARSKQNNTGKSCLMLQQTDTERHALGGCGQGRVVSEEQEGNHSQYLDNGIVPRSGLQAFLTVSVLKMQFCQQPMITTGLVQSDRLIRRCLCIGEMLKAMPRPRTGAKADALHGFSFPVEIDGLSYLLSFRRCELGRCTFRYRLKGLSSTSFVSEVEN